LILIIISQTILLDNYITKQSKNPVKFITNYTSIFCATCTKTKFIFGYIHLKEKLS